MILPPIPILVIAIMISMMILGLIRPPLTVVLPLLGIYVILMLMPYLLPNLIINQYLNIKYVILPVIGLALGYGISVLASKYMNVDVRSLLGLGKGRGRGGRLGTTGKSSGKRRTQIRPEDLDRLINESINAMMGATKLGILRGETLGSWVEYYDGWADAVLGIYRRFADIKDSAEMINNDAPILSRIRQYEDKALSLGLTLMDESSFKNKKRRRTGGEYGEGELIIYVRPEELASELIGMAQLISGYVDEYNKVLEFLVNNKEDLSQYIANSRVLVLYVDGIPRKFIVIGNEST